jgi:tetratricopeptide (TPR) repeat protein
LEILNIDKSSYSRVQWVDPKTHADIIRNLPRDQAAVQITSLPPGEVELEFYDAQNRGHRLKVKLQAGKNDLDLTKARLTDLAPANPTYAARMRRGSWPRALAQSASLAPYMPSRVGRAAPPAATSTETEATLLVQLESGTQVYVDGSSFGASRGNDRFLQLEGLAPGYHNLTLIPSPDRERRFRVKLFKGSQIFDPPSGEIRSIAEIQPPPDQIAVPPNLPANVAQDYRRFQQALWQEHLVTPAGESAWDYFQRIQGALPPSMREELQRQLTVAMGNRAQRTILKYLRGGDIVWNAALFDEGADLLDRTQRLFKASTAFEPQRRFFAGRAFIERGDYAQAVPELQRALAIDPEAAYAYNALGLALWKQNRLQDAIQPLQRSIQLAPNWTYPRDTLALIYVEQRQYSTAEQAFQTAVQINAQDSAAYHGLGQLYLLQGQLQDADVQLRRAVEVNPGNAYAYETLGKLYQRQLRNSQAEQMFRLAIRLEPDEPSFQISLGELLRQIGRIQDAQPILARAVDRNPNNLMALQAYASFLTDQNRLPEAEKLFKQAFKNSPEDSNLHVGYGLLLQKQGRGSDAEKEFKAAIRIKPDNPYARYNLASIYIEQKKIADAEKELLLAEKADPRFAKTPLLLGQIRLAQKRYPEALEQYRKALALSIEVAQKQEIEGYIEEAEGAIVREKLEQAKAKTERKDYRDAWVLYADTLKTAPDYRQLRDAILKFQEEHPGDADVSILPPSNLSEVFKTTFWKNQRQADELWQKAQKPAALETFLSTVEHLSPAERRVVMSTSFNLGNTDYGIHQIIYRWGLRLVGDSNYAGALKLLDAALSQKIFGAVPDFKPLTIDSLMIPPDVADPKKFSDFEVAHHPDRRAHELYAAAYAGSGDMVKARQYLAALESTGPDLAVRAKIAKTLQQEKNWDRAGEILKEVINDSHLVSQPDQLAGVFLLLAEIQCQSGDCAGGRKTLENGLRVLPNSQRIKEALRRF